jgi:hypothetical protein
MITNLVTNFLNEEFTMLINIPIFGLEYIIDKLVWDFYYLFIKYCS